MSFASIEPMLPLLAATTVGLVGSLLGYDLAKVLLSWGGGLGGAAIGGAVGWFGPALADYAVTVETQLLLAAALAFAGSVLGYSLFPFLTRVVTGVVGFVVTAIPAYALAAGRRVVDPTAVADPSAALQLAVLVEAVQNEALLSGGRSTQFAVVAAVAGGVTLVLAWRYYVLIAAVVANVVGATVLAYVAPLWTHWYRTGELLGADALAFTPLWFVVALAVGGGLQFARHSGGGNDLPRREYTDPFE
ncbi:hypothetical protein [Halomicrococcus gelatinilyticus]|uniref:hypothetical protein n=1 Tax=Halomicrococcus gelatinilyticus TaxID=1702103 RepID=UPI002E1004A5